MNNPDDELLQYLYESMYAPVSGDNTDNKDEQNYGTMELDPDEESDVESSGDVKSLNKKDNTKKYEDGVESPRSWMDEDGEDRVISYHDEMKRAKMGAQMGTSNDPRG